MNGRQVLKILKDLSPDVKVILSSGYSLNGLGEQAPETAGDGFIQKPYQIQQLASILNTVLRGQTSPA